MELTMRRQTYITLRKLAIAVTNYRNLQKSVQTTPVVQAAAAS
jgi:hypothetical protein